MVWPAFPSRRSQTRSIESVRTPPVVEDALGRFDLICPSAATFVWLSIGVGNGKVPIDVAWESLCKCFFCVKENLGGGFKYFLFSPLLGEDSHFD